ncbi:MAG: CoA-binding protein [Anaerolineae bacterium]|nr:CoA-binding protein [Anaerolineae bacterium]
MNDVELRRLLSGSRSVAVYGMSRSPTKASHRVGSFLIRTGYDVIPVNPFADEILGRPCYASLMDVPGSVDIVDVFRPSEDALAVVEEAVRRHRERGDVSLIWLQLGIVNGAAQALAIEAGISFVQDRCMAVEIPRLFPRGLGVETSV